VSGRAPIEYSSREVAACATMLLATMAAATVTTITIFIQCPRRSPLMS